MDLNPDEVRIKQEMADACEQVIGIIDGTKWHRSALLSFVAADDVHGIVTDASAPADEVRGVARARRRGDRRRGEARRRSRAVRPRDLRRGPRDHGSAG